MKRCGTCEQWQPLLEFNQKHDAEDGLQNTCRTCNRAASRNYYAANRDKHRAVVKAKKKLVVARSQELLAAYLKAHPCVDCGNSDIRVLEFDHVVAKYKDVTRLMHNGCSWDTVLVEISKCEVRCKNCHAIKTYERIGGSWRDKFI